MGGAAQLAAGSLVHRDGAMAIRGSGRYSDIAVGGTNAKASGHLFFAFGGGRIAILLRGVGGSLRYQWIVAPLA